MEMSGKPHAPAASPQEKNPGTHWTGSSVGPIPVSSRFEAWVCGLSLAGIAGSNPAGGTDVCLLWVLSGRGLWDGPIPRPDESYWVRVCVI
jgi:hypothetical protein